MDTRKSMDKKVPRKSIPNTQSYLQILSAKNRLAALKTQDYKWAQENLSEDLRNIQMEKINLKMKASEKLLKSKNFRSKI